MKVRYPLSKIAIADVACPLMLAKPEEVVLANMAYDILLVKKREDAK